MIEKNRIDLQGKLASTIVEANTPFEFIPSHSCQRAAVLAHGLLDCPFVLKDIGMSLYNEGLHIRSILLPGHGTVPGGLLNVRFEQWIAAFEGACKSFPDHITEIYLVGYSTGALLALHHALLNKNDPRMKGLILLCPAIKINTCFDFLLPLSPWFQLIGKRGAWARIAIENDYTKYQSITFNSAYQVYQLGNLVKRLTKEAMFSYPVLTILTSEDKTISSNAALSYFEQFDPQQIRVKLYNQENHLSHVAVPISPQNPHYGMHGDYSKGDTNFYNPEFVNMINEIKQFIFA